MLFHIFGSVCDILNSNYKFLAVAKLLNRQRTFQVSSYVKRHKNFKHPGVFTKVLILQDKKKGWSSDRIIHNILNR